MNYKLSKQLKDAGFPQDGDGKPYSIVAELRGEDICSDGKENVYYPTLSELIEACGDDFTYIWKEYGGNFLAGKEQLDKDGKQESNNFQTTGKTPEEAVAKLYLKINKK